MSLSSPDHPVAAVSNRSSAALDRLAFGCLVAAIVWAPWPLGSNRSWAVGLLAGIVWVGLLAGLLAQGLARTGQSSLRAESAASTRRRSGASLIPLGAMAGFGLLQIVQLMPGLGVDGGAISVDPFHTRAYLLTTCVYLGAWLLVQQTIRSDARAMRLLAAVVAAGALQALGAVALYSTGWTYVFLYADFEQGGRAMATFPSPDNLAGYLELDLSASLGWMLSQFGQHDGPQGTGWRANVVGALAFVMSGKMLLRLVMVMMVIALVMTHSRMGNSAFFIALSASSLVVAMVSTTLRRPALWLVLSMTIIDVLVVGQWVGLERVVERLQDTATASTAPSGFGGAAAPVQREESIQQRLVVPRLSLDLVADRPWLGHGGGTYATTFPRFKPADFSGRSLYWDHAHDDYVQVACDMGLVGLALWVSIGVSTLWRAVRLLGDDQNRHRRGVAAGGVMAIGCMGLHSVVDFNLHIPAIAMTFTVLLAAVWALPRGRTAVTAQRSIGGSNRTSAAMWSGAATWAGFALACGLSLWVFWQAQRLFRADWASARERRLVAEWVSGAVKPPAEDAWRDAEAAIGSSIRTTPDDPDLIERMGDLHTVAGQRDWGDVALRRNHFREAAGFYRRSVALRPTEATTWAMLAAASQAAGETGADVHDAWARARALGPYEGTVQPVLMQVVLSDWESAAPAMKNWANRLFDQGDEGTRRAVNALAARYGLVFEPDPVLPPP